MNPWKLYYGPRLSAEDKWRSQDPIFAGLAAAIADHVAKSVATQVKHEHMADVVALSDHRVPQVIVSDETFELLAEWHSEQSAG